MAEISGDMFGRAWPGEPYAIEFEPTAEQTAAIERLAARHNSIDLLPMLLGVTS